MKLRFKKVGKNQAELVELPALSALSALVKVLGDGSMPADQAVACLLALRKVLPLEWWHDVTSAWVRSQTAQLPGMDAWSMLQLFRHVSEVAVVPGLVEVLTERIMLEGKGEDWLLDADDSLGWVDR